MVALTRKFKKIFAKDSANNGVFGSAAALAPATSTNPETIESLAAFLTGWEDATEGGLKLPTLEDMQGLKYDTDYHLAYIYQTGLQVYDSQTTYYTTDLVRKAETNEIWKSLIDDNTGNALVAGVNWSLVGDLSYLPTAALGTAAYVNTGVSSGNVPLVGTRSATTSLAGTSYLVDSPPIFIYSTGNAISFIAGNTTSQDGSCQIVSSYSGTKTISSTWVAGAGNGGLDTGVAANNTWYYAYTILNPTTGATDYLISASPTSPTIPSGYTQRKRLKGFFKTDGSAAIIQFTLRDGTWNFQGVASAQVLVSGTSQVGSAGAVSNAFPTVAIEAFIQTSLSLTTTGTSTFTIWGNLQSTPTTGNGYSSGLIGSSISTNNAFEASGTGRVVASDGVFRFQNFEFSGGVDAIRAFYLSVKDISTY